MNTSWEVLGWALSSITITVNPSIEMEVHTAEEYVLSHDTCIRDNDLSRLTGKRVTELPDGRKIEICTPVLMRNQESE